MAEAGRLLLADRQSWRGTLVLAFVADEEINSTGAKAAAAESVRLRGDRRADAQRGVRGAQGLRATADPRARQGGAFRPAGPGQRTQSSRAARLVELLAQRDAMLRQRHHPLVGHASLTVSRIAGGIADNIVPDLCEIVLDERVLPGARLESTLDDLHDLLRRAREEHGVDAELAQVRTAAGSAETPPDSPLLHAALAAARQPWRDAAAAGRADRRLRPRAFPRSRQRRHHSRPRLAGSGAPA